MSTALDSASDCTEDRFESDECLLLALSAAAAVEAASDDRPTSPEDEGSKNSSPANRSVVALEVSERMGRLPAPAPPSSMDMSNS